MGKKTDCALHVSLLEGETFIFENLEINCQLSINLGMMSLENTLFYFQGSVSRLSLVYQNKENYCSEYSFQYKGGLLLATDQLSNLSQFSNFEFGTSKFNKKIANTLPLTWRVQIYSKLRQPLEQIYSI